MPDLDELLKRVESAREGNRGLDGLIARDLDGWVQHFTLEDDRLIQWPDMGGHWHPPGQSLDCDSVPLNDDPPHYTTSIDAAIELVERLDSEDGWAFARMNNGAATAEVGDTFATHESAPLALLAALLRALKDKEAG